jgi:predicted amidohydrolase YtcJ
MGGWNFAQFAEKRMPTLAELDAADADHPVVVYQSFTGPAAVNTKAKAFFAGKSVAVSDTGAIAINAPSLAALNALRAVQTFADQKRGTMDALNYSASVGVTTDVDMGAFIPPGAPDTQDSFAADYQDDEYTLLGKAIKFAGLHGKELRIIGTKRETLKGSRKPELLH